MTRFELEETKWGNQFNIQTNDGTIIKLMLDDVDTKLLLDLELKLR